MQSEESRSSHMFVAEWDEEGVFFYQAFNEHIADWAVQEQQFGGPHFKPERMTWIKPSLAWVLYRAGYGFKDPNQSRILKIKVAHSAVAEILSQCACGHGGGGTLGRVQWDPARCLDRGEGGEPAKHPEMRAIQIGMKGTLSRFYVQNALSIQDVTSLAHQVCSAHEEGRGVDAPLPEERPYFPQCTKEIFSRLKLSEVAQGTGTSHEEALPRCFVCTGFQGCAEVHDP